MWNFFLYFLYFIYILSFKIFARNLPAKGSGEIAIKFDYKCSAKSYPGSTVFHVISAVESTARVEFPQVVDTFCVMYKSTTKNSYGLWDNVVQMVLGFLRTW